MLNKVSTKLIGICTTNTVRGCQYKLQLFSPWRSEQGGKNRGNLLRQYISAQSALLLILGVVQREVSAILLQSTLFVMCSFLISTDQFPDLVYLHIRRFLTLLSISSVFEKYCKIASSWDNTCLWWRKEK